jgi:hypothetical protein
MIAGGIAAALALGFFADAALAKPYRAVPIKGTHSRSEIEGACLAHGGFVDGTRASSGTYGCTNTSAGTSIGCTSNGHCTGYVPN